MANPATAKYRGPSATFKLGGVAKEAVTDMSAYPILTEEIGYPPSPVASPTPSGGNTPIGQIAAKAVADVLGWKLKPGDAKGFMGALTQSFSLTNVEGHIDARWTPRTYAVQSDLSGGVTGAQASIYARSLEALDKIGPLVDGLYPLRVDASPEDISAIKAVLMSQITEAVNELGLLGGPRVSRVNQYFSLLLGTTGFVPAVGTSKGLVQSDPDSVSGTLGYLRDELGLWSIVAPSGGVFPASNAPLINTVDDEQDVTNFRIIVDYITSLATSWNNNQTFFGLSSTTPFFGTQLVILSRQLSVVADAVDEVRFTMDSVFITPSERQTLEVDFPAFVGLAAHPPVRPAAIPASVQAGVVLVVNDNHIDTPSMFMEDLLTWAQSFAAEEAPKLVQEGGKFAVSNSVLPMCVRLRNLVLGTMHAANLGDLPKGFKTPRVQRALGDLSSQLDELAFLANPLSYTIPSQK